MCNDLGDLIVADLLEQGLDPLAALASACSVEFLRHSPQVGVGVVEVQALDGLAEAVFDQIPNPDGPVGDDQHPLGLGQTTEPGLVVELLHQGFDPAPGRYVAALGDDGAQFGFGTSLGRAVAEPETGGRVNPMPAVHLLVLASPLFGLAPVVAFANVPGVDLDNQRKGWRGLVQSGDGFGGGARRHPPRCLDELLADLDGVVPLALGFTGQGAAA